MTNVLDHPLWSSLATVHRDLALTSGGVARYPAEVAPFLATDAPRASDDALAALVPPGDTVFLVGPAPEVPPGWRLEPLGEIVQMVFDGSIVAHRDAAIVPLGDREHAAVLELAMLVYPHYFRPRTTELGRYFGVIEAGRLVAMIGERMAMPGLREISAVCTHPEAVGRGLARQLLAFVVDDLVARGIQPFLHVSPSNERARRLYEQNGFTTRRMIGFWSLCRAE
ncbi:MAG TPA: GNAT family N-acetyltransferase [Kofleriaceae bacterium]